MSVIQIGDEVPNFTAFTQLGPLNFHNYSTGSWCLFFAHPADFTPVCTTEFGMVSKLEDEFKARNCKILGLSIDSVEQHELWIRDINETQETEVRFPIVADEDGSIAAKFAFAVVDSEKLHEQEGKAMEQTEGVLPLTIKSRGMYLIDPLRRVQLSSVYPSNVGRNFYEIIRALDALQLGSLYQVGTPANWKAGEDVFILPEVEDDEAEKLFPRGFTAIKPYLRITPMPDMDVTGAGNVIQESKAY